jgi:tetratricopeptide (TPR) repeat protein
MSLCDRGTYSEPNFLYNIGAAYQNTGEPLARYLDKPYIEGDDRLNLISARRILSHTSGLPNWRPQNQPLKIHFTPGKRFSYSGEGFVYLQNVIEHLTRHSLNEIMQETVFAPLSMKNSSYVWRKEYEVQKVTGHDEAGNPQPVWKPQTANAASSLHTTATDYANFVVAILKDSGLKQSTIREMLTQQIIVDDGCRECIDNAAQQSPSKDISWGLGWGLQKAGKAFSFWHWGDNNSTFQCYVAAIPSQNSGIVILTNSGNGHSIIPDLLMRVIGETHPAYSWINYEPYNSPLKNLFHDIRKRGMHAITDFRNEGQATARFSESQFNRLGYWLLGRKKTQEAIEVFKINVSNHPESWNAHDSLGEAYLLDGNRQLSIQSYRKSLELNPDNSNASEVLKKLTATQ